MSAICSSPTSWFSWPVIDTPLSPGPRVGPLSARYGRMQSGTMSFDRFEDAVRRLRAAGSVFAEDEARLLGADERLIARRIAGERLEHVLGWVDFCGLRLDVGPGVFIPRPQTEALAQHAASLRPKIALDLFAGCGAIACVVKARNPDARVVAGELDPAAVACARRNGDRYGVEVFESDVDAGIPSDLAGRVDVLTANVPYVPTPELAFVPHD